MVKNGKNSKTISLKMNSVWSLVGSLVYALTQWGLVIVIAKYGTTEMVGIFTLALALTAPVVLLMRFNLRLAVASDSNDEFQYNEYFTFRIISTIAFLMIMIIVSMFYPTDSYTFLVIILLSTAKVFESISDVLYGQLQKKERLDLVAKSRILKGILSFGLFSMIMVFTTNLILATFGLMLTWFFVLIVYDFRITNKFGKILINLNKGQQLLILKLTIPLGLAQLIASLISNIPRYFIEYYHDIVTLGFFSAIIYIITAGTNVFIAISNAIIPRLALYYQNGKIKKYIRLLSTVISFVALIGSIALIFVNFYGGELLKLLYSNEYSPYTKEFFLLTLFGVIRYGSIFVNTGITSTRKFIIEPYTNGITLVIVLLFSYFLIPISGMVGAAYALLIAESLQLIIRVLILSYLLVRQYRNSKVIT